jgi:hypothetical protein
MVVSQQGFWKEGREGRKEEKKRRKGERTKEGGKGEGHG